jgi:alpha-glucosidase (family GH31 glycosyl hydrolase)
MQTTGVQVVRALGLALALLLLGCADFRNFRQRIHVPAFLDPPSLEFPAGPEVGIDVRVGPFALDVSGDARLERLDAHRIRLRSPSGNLAIRLAPGEAIYGLTARIVSEREASETDVQAVGGLDRRGERVAMWVIPSEAVYAPFYVSSRGYGMWIEGTHPGTYDIGRAEPDLLRTNWSVGPEGLSAVFVEGPAYTDILERYTAMTGRPILTPEWVFLPWKWRDEVASGKYAELDGVTLNAEVVDDITGYEKLGFPVGVYLIDRPWAAGNYGYGNLDWDPERFPNGDAMVRLLQARGWRVIVWGAPWALGHHDWEHGSEARARGYLIGDRNIDYTNPEAAAWQRGKLEAFMRRSGIDGWKLDRGDEYNPSHPDDIYHDGRSGLVVHNDYPRMYVENFHAAARAVRGDDFVLKARPAYTGTTQWSIVYGGDIPGAVGLFRKQATDKGLRSAIIGMQRTAFMGYPVWGSDTGGYEGFRERELFARWLAFSAFCPLMEIGGVGPHEPWAMPTEPRFDEEMIAIYRRYTWLHARLRDYTYALSRRAHETGDPIVHPLVFDWPDDPQLRDLWDEYMYGPSLLVAPVWEHGRREREVYLPAGEWIDLWDPMRKFTGPSRVTVAAPLDRIPVFVKADAARLLPPDLMDVPAVTSAGRSSSR